MAFYPYYEEHPYDIIAPWVPAPVYSPSHHKPWNHIVVPRVDSKGGTDITMDKDKFQVSLDVHQFTPDEIKVKTLEKHIIVEGKHEEKEDDHGTVSRHFIRKYLLPEGHHSDDVTTTLSSDGIVCITCPKRKDSKDPLERIVPIKMVGPLNGHIKKAGVDNGTNGKIDEKVEAKMEE